jgi:hypothetical protein
MADPFLLSCAVGLRSTWESIWHMVCQNASVSFAVACAAAAVAHPDERACKHE